MSTKNQQGRVTLESLKEKPTLPIVQWNSRNTWFVLGCGVIGGGIAVELGLGLAGGIPLALVCLYLGYDLVRSTPPYCNVTDWIKTNLRYWRRPAKYANTAEALLEVDNTIRAAIKTPETTREVTGVKRFYPPHGIIERDDRSYAMMLRYTPPNMDFSTEQEFNSLMDTIAKGYNNTVDFDITLHNTTRPVDMESYFERLAERMDDPDAEQNEVFKAILQEMKEDRRRMLQQSNTEIVHFYIIISVHEDEVDDVVGGDDDAEERSRLFSIFSQDGDEDSEAEKVKERRIKKMLDERARTVQSLVTGGSEILEDASIDRVPTTEAAGVLESYWTGNNVPLDPDEEQNPVPMTVTSRGPKEGEFDINDVSEVVHS